MGDSRCNNCEDVAELRRRLAESEESLQAIRRGEVDAFVVNTPQGEQVYTLQGTDTIYRKILEEMAEGAATLSDENIILYSNQSFAKMAGSPLENVMGTNFFDYVSPNNIESLSVLGRGGEPGYRRGQRRVPNHFARWKDYPRSGLAEVDIDLRLEGCLHRRY